MAILNRCTKCGKLDVQVTYKGTRRIVQCAACDTCCQYPRLTDILDYTKCTTCGNVTNKRASKPANMRTIGKQ